MKKTLSPRTFELLKKLRNELEDRPFSYQLPPVRELMKRYRVGRSVLDSALDELEAQSVIRRVPYIGIFNQLKDGNRKLQITLVTPDWPGEIFSRLCNEMELAIQHEKRFHFNRVALKDPYFSSLTETMGDILMLLPPSKPLTLHDLTRIESLRRPCILLGRYLYDLDQHYTNTMPGYGGSLAAMHFLQNGHKKLAVLVSEPHIAEVNIRVSNFQNYAFMHGIEVKVIDCNVRSSESAPGKAYDTLKHYLEQHGCDFTALFVVSDASAIGALRALHEFDVKIPEQVSVIGYDGLEQANYYTPPLTTIYDDYREFAGKLVSEIGRFFDGAIPRIQIEQRPRLLERASVAPPPEQN